METLKAHLKLFGAFMEGKGYTGEFRLEGTPSGSLTQSLIRFAEKRQAGGESISAFTAHPHTYLSASLGPGECRCCTFKMRYDQRTGFFVLAIDLSREADNVKQTSACKLTIYDLSHMPTARQVAALSAHLQVPVKAQHHKRLRI